MVEVEAPVESCLLLKSEADVGLGAFLEEEAVAELEVEMTEKSTSELGVVEVSPESLKCALRQLKSLALMLSRLNSSHCFQKVNSTYSID